MLREYSQHYNILDVLNQVSCSCCPYSHSVDGRLHRTCYHGPQRFPQLFLQHYARNHQLSNRFQEFTQQPIHRYSYYLREGPGNLYSTAVVPCRTHSSVPSWMLLPDLLLQLLSREVFLFLCRKCGRRINAGSYYPSCVNCSVYLFFIFSLLLIAMGVASFILASDLDKTSNTTLCSV